MLAPCTRFPEESPLLTAPRRIGRARCIFAGAVVAAIVLLAALRPQWPPANTSLQTNSYLLVERLESALLAAEPDSIVVSTDGRRIHFRCDTTGVASLIEFDPHALTCHLIADYPVARRELLWVSSQDCHFELIDGNLLRIVLEEPSWLAGNPSRDPVRFADLLVLPV